VIHDRALIERTLQVVVGMPLWGCGHIGAMVMLQFGARHDVVIRFGARKGSTKAVGDHALHLQCAWRLGGPDGIIVASGDVFLPPDNAPPDWRWDESSINRYEERIGTWLAATAAAPPVVTAIAADDFGGLDITLSDGHHLTVFVDASSRDEQWRFFQPARDTDHLVVTGTGINDQSR
jgi:hypothetical protein